MRSLSPVVQSCCRVRRSSSLHLEGFRSTRARERRHAHAQLLRLSRYYEISDHDWIRGQDIYWFVADGVW